MWNLECWPRQNLLFICIKKMHSLVVLRLTQFQCCILHFLWAVSTLQASEINAVIPVTWYAVDCCKWLYYLTQSTTVWYSCILPISLQCVPLGRWVRNCGSIHIVSQCILHMSYLCQCAPYIWIICARVPHKYDFFGWKPHGNISEFCHKTLKYYGFVILTV